MEKVTAAHKRPLGHTSPHTYVYCTFVLIFLCAGGLFAQGGELVALNAATAENRTEALIQGYDAFKEKDWPSATLFLRRALSSPQNSSAEALYMLIMSQVYAEDYGAVVTDCDTFAHRYTESSLSPFICYQQGRALYFLGRNDEAVMTLSDFCHHYPENPLYGSALFYLGECFFDDYNFDTARSLYERVVTDFPTDAHAQDAQFRLDSLLQAEREQKLLYLLKMTGEEYLSSRENYEKQLRQYQTEDMIGLRRQLNAANARIAELEQAALGQPERETSGVSDDELEALKRKAAAVQDLLDQKKSPDGTIPYTMQGETK